MHPHILALLHTILLDRHVYNAYMHITNPYEHFMAIRVPCMEVYAIINLLGFQVVTKNFSWSFSKILVLDSDGITQGQMPSSNFCISLYDPSVLIQTTFKKIPHRIAPLTVVRGLCHTPPWKISSKEKSGRKGDWLVCELRTLLSSHQSP